MKTVNGYLTGSLVESGIYLTCYVQVKYTSTVTPKKSKFYEASAV